MPTSYSQASCQQLREACYVSTFLLGLAFPLRDRPKDAFATKSGTPYNVFESTILNGLPTHAVTLTCRLLSTTTSPISRIRYGEHWHGNTTLCNVREQMLTACSSHRRQPFWKTKPARLSLALPQ